MFRLFRRRNAGIVQIAPDVWEKVERTLTFLEYLPDEDRLRLRRLALKFLAMKQFYGANGLQLGDDILLSIALQACLPILNIGLDAYRGWVGIVVYPGEIVIPRHETDEDGLVHEFDDIVLGEAWQGGPVLLSWFADDEMRPNVVLHEFAHKLDMANGEADGFPPLPPDMSRQTWAHTFSQAFKTLRNQINRGEDTALDPYAAEHPAEFFAVASEVFFEDPLLLKEAYPAVYEQLALFYRQNPDRYAQ